MSRHWSEKLSCHACGTTFRSATAEARHRHNFPVMCKRNAAFKRFTEENARAEIQRVLTEAMTALQPFAACAGELDADDDRPRAPDGEWAKFRLLTDDYRRAREAFQNIERYRKD